MLVDEPASMATRPVRVRVRDVRYRHSSREKPVSPRGCWSRTLITRETSFTGHGAKIMAFRMVNRLVASPMAVRHLRGEGLTHEGIRALGPECFVTVKLWPVGDQINVHAKVTTINGWMLWSTDRVFPTPKALSARQLDLSADLSKEVLREIRALWKREVAQAR